ncbi:MAG: DUF3800 domain-containing protein [Lachnospiraceae bacterium]|nr:DUF3800 domain-containing protein [Lachnospiraceae bacterium]
MQEVIFFFDDSGVMHKNAPGGYFVYAGYVFTSREELNHARRKYINANKKLKESLGRSDELKAANLKPRHKRALYEAVKEYASVSVIVDLSRVYDYILKDKKSICRYKDYVLKRCVKNRLKRLIANGDINKDEDIEIHIYIDEQLTATNGYYDLRDSIREELQYGIVNFNYGITHPHVFDSNVIVNIEYCDSSRNYMIQASDILANRIWSSYVKDKKELRKIPNHAPLTFP